MNAMRVGIRPPIHVVKVQMRAYMYHNIFVGTLDVTRGCVILSLVILFVAMILLENVPDHYSTWW